MSHSAEKCKRGTLWDFSTSILLQNRKKLKEGPFGDIIKICEKKSLQAEIKCKKLVKGETRTHVLLLGRPQKILYNLYAKCQLKKQFSMAVSGNQLIQLIKSVISLVFKKNQCYSLRFLRKSAD